MARQRQDADAAARNCAHGDAGRGRIRTSRGAVRRARRRGGASRNQEGELAMTETSASKVFEWAKLPSIELLGGTMRRTGFRGDDLLLTFNRIKPTMQRWEPHHHPFDQIVLTVKGRQLLEVEGEAMECGPGTIVRVPANAKHTGWPIGDEEVVNIDVFAPPRADYLFLVEHQKEYPQPPTQGKDAPTVYHQVHASS